MSSSSSRKLVRGKKNVISLNTVSFERDFIFPLENLNIKLKNFLNTYLFKNQLENGYYLHILGVLKIRGQFKSLKHAVKIF